MKTYLVTGGAGFIGSNFIRHLLKVHSDICVINLDALTYAGNLDNLSDVEADKRYNFIKGDICDYELVTNIFEFFSVDFVVHFAAESHVDRSISAPDIFVNTNVLGTLNMIKCASTAWQNVAGGYVDGVKFVQVSTDEVYGSLGKSGFFTETTHLDPHSPYAASKASADLLVKSYWDTFGFPMNITRCSNNYGPYQFPEKLIPLMITNCLSHKSLPIYGDGLQVRDWIYVEDHCKAIELVLHKGKTGEIYNIGGHNEKTNIFIVQTIIDYVNKNVDSQVDEKLISYVTDRKGHDVRYGIDPQKIINDLGWKSETKFEMGIIKTIQWYLEHKTWLKNASTRT